MTMTDFIRADQLEIHAIANLDWIKDCIQKVDDIDESWSLIAGMLAAHMEAPVTIDEACEAVAKAAKHEDGPTCD